MKRAFRIFVLAFVFAMPFCTKKFLGVLLPDFFDYLREFSSAFLHATDLLALAAAALACAALGRRALPGRTAGIAAMALLLLAAASIAFSPNAALSAYHFAGLALAMGAGFAVSAALREGVVAFRDILRALAVSGAAQSAIGIAQFVLQKSVGLARLGEPAVTAATKGVARFAVGGESVLRSFGTLPHANIYAAAVAIGLCAALALAVSAERRTERVAALCAAALALPALVFSFSRSGWIATALSVSFFFAWCVRDRASRPAAVRALAALAAISCVTIFAFRHMIFPRAGFSMRERSVSERVTYNRIGFDLLATHPFGAGIGAMPLAASDAGMYQARGLPERWYWQPVHNMYLLVADELGIAGFAAFVFLIALAFRAARPFRFETAAALALFSIPLAFGLFDHFPWDLHAGRLPFWTFFAILIGLRERTPS